jgi:PBP1b-binding outer membrane lipoprotein LpoB
MKKFVIVLFATVFFTACSNEAQQSDNQKTETSSEASEAADTSNLVDKAQEGMNEVIDTLQSKGDKLADTLKKKVVEPVKADVKKVMEKVKEKVSQE